MFFQIVRGPAGFDSFSKVKSPNLKKTVLFRINCVLYFPHKSDITCKKNSYIVFKYLKIIVTSRNNKTNEAHGYVKLVIFVEVLKNSLSESGRKILECAINKAGEFSKKLKVSVYFSNNLAVIKIIANICVEWKFNRIRKNSFSDF